MHHRTHAHSAAIVPKSDYISKLTSAEIISLLSSALPKHCVPVLVVFYDALPRNGVGKTDKRVLKEALGKIWVEGQEQGRAGASTGGGGKQVQVSAKL